MLTEEQLKQVSLTVDERIFFRFLPGGAAVFVLTFLLGFFANQIFYPELRIALEQTEELNDRLDSAIRAQFYDDWPLFINCRPKSKNDVKLPTGIFYLAELGRITDDGVFWAASYRLDHFNNENSWIINFDANKEIESLEEAEGVTFDDCKEGVSVYELTKLDFGKGNNVESQARIRGLLDVVIILIVIFIVGNSILKRVWNNFSSKVRRSG
ncbi:MAG: hypothetical protein AAFR11_14835 [Pseudomonadota bacterium]